MSLFAAITRALFVPRQSIGQFTAYLTIEEIANDDIEITQHPVQEGSTITDHAYIKPSTVAMKLIFDNRTDPIEEIYRNLVFLQSSRVLIDVVTTKREYSNMLIRSLTQTTDMQTNNVLSINLQLQQITITQIETVEVPERSKQKTPSLTGAKENAGKKQAQSVEEPQRRSALSALLS